LDPPIPNLGRIYNNLGQCDSIAFAPDGRHLVAADAPDSLRIGDVTSGQKVRTLKGEGHWFRGTSPCWDDPRLRQQRWGKPSDINLWFKNGTCVSR
jgi:hypothetical protein